MQSKILTILNPKNHGSDKIAKSTANKINGKLHTQNCQLNNGVACGPCYPLILHKALATRPVSATITTANWASN